MINRNCVLFAFIIMSSLWLTGCMTTAAVTSMTTHEAMKARTIFVRSDGAIIIPVTSTYWRDSVFNGNVATQGEGPRVILKKKRDRLVVISRADLENAIAELSADPNHETPYRMNYFNISGRSGGFRQATVMPNRFWAPSVGIQELKSQSQLKYTEYDIKQPVPYNFRGETVWLDFNKMTISGRNRLNPLRFPVIFPAMLGDASMGVFTVAVAAVSIPVAIVMIPYTIYALIKESGEGVPKKGTPKPNPPAENHDQHTPSQVQPATE